MLAKNNVVLKCSFLNNVGTYIYIKECFLLMILCLQKNQKPCIRLILLKLDSRIAYTQNNYFLFVRSRSGFINSRMNKDWFSSEKEKKNSVNENIITCLQRFPESVTCWFHVMFSYNTWERYMFSKKLAPKR